MIPVGYCTHLAFTPGSSQLAVITGRKPLAIEVRAVPGGELLRTLPLPGGDPLSCWANQIVHLGDAVVHMEMQASKSPRQWKVVRHRAPHWRREVLLEFAEEHQVLIAPVRDGYVIVRESQFLVGDADGSLREPVRVPQLAGRRVTLLDTDGQTGRIALVSRPEPWARGYWLTILGPDLEVLAECPSEFEIYHGWLCGPDLLVTQGQWHVMHCWRLADGELTDVGGRHLNKHEHRYDVHMPPLGTTALPLRTIVAVERDGVSTPPLWLDAVTGKDTEPPPYGDRFPIWVSPGGRYLVFRNRNYSGPDELELTADPAFPPGDVDPDRV